MTFEKDKCRLYEIICKRKKYIKTNSKTKQNIYTPSVRSQNDNIRKNDTYIIGLQINIYDVCIIYINNKEKMDPKEEVGQKKNMAK